MSGVLFSDLLASITERGRAVLGLTQREARRVDGQTSIVELCERLLSGRGEASGTAIARAVLDAYNHLDETGKKDFFLILAQSFGCDKSALLQAVDRWKQEETAERAAELHYRSEPRRQELLRRLNYAAGGTAALVTMRETLIAHLPSHPALRAVDRDFVHLFSSWFNRGFLVPRRIDWSSPAIVLEKIIRYEAVHQIHGWDDLRRRLDPPDRRCYAFFHPALIDEPLIFVEIALCEEMPSAIQPLLAHDRTVVPAGKAKTAVFYSISNCQQGLSGVSFGNFLIKQVVEELRRDLPGITTFVTLSPVPGFVRWMRTEAMPRMSAQDREAVAFLEDPHWWTEPGLAVKMPPTLERLAGQYFLGARLPNGRPVDPVSRFHLGNGARLERINWVGDISPKGIQESAGLMVNYLYDLDRIEANHEAYANNGEIVASPEVRSPLSPDPSGNSFRTRSSSRGDASKKSARP